MAMGIGSVWGVTTYRLTQVSEVEAGGLYVFEQSGHVMNNTLSSSALQTTTSYNTSGLSGTETYIWTLEAASGGFYLKNVSLKSDSYLNNDADGKTNVSFGNKSSIWTFAFTDGIALISNKSNSNRFLGFTNATSYAYKAYAASNLDSYDHAITVYKLVEEADMTDSDFALADDPVELSFDLYNNSSAQVISYTTSSTGEITVSGGEGYINSSVNATNKTITVTPTAVTPSTLTITVKQAADNTYRAGTATFTVTIADSTPIPTHTATFSVNGTITTQDFEEGGTIAFPENPADISGKSFVGWVTSAIDGTTNEAPTFVTSATMGQSNVTFYAVFAEKTPGTQTTVTDELTSALTGVTGTGSYANWSGKTATSAAVYAGNSAVASGSEVVNAGAIQMRSSNNSGIISTTSGGTLKSVTVTWTGGNERTLDIYCSKTAYTAASDLYDSKKQGTKLGSIVKGTSTSLTISGDYAYVGLRSNNGALYLDNISIDWTTGTPDTYSAYCTTVSDDNREEAGISFAEATVTEEIVNNYTGQTLTNPNNVSPITWTSSNETVATVEDGTVTVLAVGETTISAAFAGDDNYKKATVSYTLTVQDSRQAIDLSFAETSVTVNISETVDAPTLNGNTGNGTVTYESSNTDIATVDASGVVTGVAVGQATITATVAATNEYQDGTATFTVKVVDPNANDGSSIEKAYTVAEAIEVIKALPNSNVTTEKYYIKGIVSSFQKTSIVGDGQYYRYFISDDGTTTTELQVFKGKGLNEATFTNKDDLLVGDEVVIYGPIQYYQNKTPEIAEGNYLVSLNRPGTITVANATVSVDAGEHDGTLALAYANLTITEMSNFNIKYYNAEGEEADEPDWLEVLVAEQDPQVGEGYVVSYVIEANDGEARAAYFKVYAEDDKTNLVYSNLVTVNQAEYVAPEETIGHFVKITSTDDITNGQYLIVSENDNVAFDGSRDNDTNKLDDVSNTIAVTIENDKIAATATNAKSVFIIDVTAGTLKSASGLYIGVSSNNNGLKTSTDATAYKHTFSINEDENAVISANFESSSMTLRFNNASNQRRFRYYTDSGQQPIQLYKFVADAEDFEVTVTSFGWATYIAEDNVSFGNDVSAFIATGNSDKSVTLTKVKAVAKGTPVVVCAEEGTHKLSAVEAADCDDVTNNKFEICDGTAAASGFNYFVLAKNGDSDACFKQWTGKLSDLTGRVVLPLALDLTQHDARSLSIVFDGEATGVKELKDSRIEGLKSVYNLNGQRVSQPKKGLYIIDGKKVFKN